MGRQSRNKRDRRELVRRSEDQQQVDPRYSQQPQFLARIQGYMFSGPLPPPEILAKYDDVSPGFAERLMTMAENNQAHRHAMEREVIPARAKLELRGQIIGAAIAFLVLAFAGWFVYLGKSTTAIGLVVGEAVTLVGLFLYSDMRKRQDLTKKKGS